MHERWVPTEEKSTIAWASRRTMSPKKSGQHALVMVSAVDALALHCFCLILGVLRLCKKNNSPQCVRHLGAASVDTHACLLLYRAHQVKHCPVCLLVPSAGCLTTLCMSLHMRGSHASKPTLDPTCMLTDPKPQQTDLIPYLHALQPYKVVKVRVGPKPWKNRPKTGATLAAHRVCCISGFVPCCCVVAHGQWFL